MGLPLFRLTPEEAALVIAQVGEGDLALQVLLATKPAPADGDEVQARLLAARDSLVAKGLVSVGTDGMMDLDAELARLGAVSAAPEFTLSVSRSRGGENREASFHFRGGVIVSQQIEAGSAYVIEEVESLDGVVEAATAFFAVDAVDGAGAVEATLPATLLDELSRAANADEARAVLTAAGAAQTVLQLFAVDYVVEAMRGGFIRTDYGHGHAVSEAGAFLVGGAERTWLLRLDGHSVGNLLLVPATRASLQDEIVRLTRQR